MNDAVKAVSEALGSSPEADEDATDVNAEATSSDASTAPEGDGEAYSRDELMDVVRKAVGDLPSDDPAPSDEGKADSPTAEGQEQESEAESEEEPKTAPDESGEEGGEAKEEDYSDVPFHNHPRFKQLIEQKNTLQAQVDELSAGAGEWDKISTFMTQHEIAPETMGRMYTAVAKANNEAAVEICDFMDAVTEGRIDDALKMARQQVSELEMLSGYQLPPEIKQRVDEGLIDEDSARELSQAQSRLQLQERLHERDRASREQEDRNSLVNGMQTAVRQWEESIRKSDPEYGLKQEFVFDRLSRHLAKGLPATQQAAVDLVQKIYDEVNKSPAFVNPARRETKKVVEGGESPRASAPEPKSMLEAVTRALQ